ncbi:hypothetical protein J3R83DRAFT_4030 [Lanmaoa asiatica]|nr:hypothetical protein J3R83DRAFT_4030 [Lanmaoa asiatica]
METDPPSWYVILILEHSFYLSQQDDPKPIFSAAQKYKASLIPARVRKALEEVVKQYSKLSLIEKRDMVVNIILQNHMGQFNVSFNLRDSSN